MQQFPFTLRQLSDRTRDHLQAELHAQAEAADKQDQNKPTYTSGEVLTLHHEAAERALLELVENAYAKGLVDNLAGQISAQQTEIARLQKGIQRSRTVKPRSRR